MHKDLETIQSRQNPLIKEIRRAWRGGGLTEHGLLPIEGPKLLHEAVRTDVPIPFLLFEESFRLDSSLSSRLQQRGTRVIRVSRDVMSSASDTEAPAGVLALAQIPHWGFNSQVAPPQALFLVLVGLQDPGNMGTIIRSAEAFKANAILTTKNTVNAYNPKSVRASAGSIFRVPVFQEFEEGALFEFFSAHGVTTIAASPQAPHSTIRERFQTPLALFVGQEAQGLAESILSRCSRQVRIPMSDSVQSLNAAIATSILLYEIRRNEETA